VRYEIRVWVGVVRGSINVSDILHRLLMEPNKGLNSDGGMGGDGDGDGDGAGRL
jgi:hypothetical protein